MADDNKTEEKKEGKKEADAKKKVLRETCLCLKLVLCVTCFFTITLFFPQVEEPELTEEDKALQDELNLLVDRLEEAKVELHKPALEQMR